MRTPRKNWPLVAAFAVAAACTPEAPVAQTHEAVSSGSPIVVAPDVNPFGTTFTVNGSTAPSPVTQYGYVTLAVTGGSGVTSADFFDGSYWFQSIDGPNPTYTIIVDESYNGSHTYSAVVHAGDASGTTFSVEITINVNMTATASFNDWGFGPIYGLELEAISGSPNGTIYTAGQYNGVAGILHFDPPQTGCDVTPMDTRPSAYTALAVDPRTNLPTYVGWTTNNSQRDIAVAIGGPPTFYNWDAVASEREFDIAGLDDEANGVAISALDGSIFVGGYVTQLSGYKDGWLTKLDKSGNTLWTQTIANAFGTDDIIASLAINPLNDDVVVGGTTVAYVDQLVPNPRGNGTTLQRRWVPVGFVKKYSTDGALLWTYLDSSTLWSSSKVVSVAVSTAGNVAIGGFDADNRVTELDTNGGHLWTILLGDSPGNAPPRVSIDWMNEVYVDQSSGPQMPARGIHIIPAPNSMFITKYGVSGKLLAHIPSNWYGFAQQLDASVWPPRYLLAGSDLYGDAFVTQFMP